MRILFGRIGGMEKKMEATTVFGVEDSETF